MRNRLRPVGNLIMVTICIVWLIFSQFRRNLALRTRIMCSLANTTFLVLNLIGAYYVLRTPAQVAWNDCAFFFSLSAGEDTWPLVIRTAHLVYFIVLAEVTAIVIGLPFTLIERSIPANLKQSKIWVGRLKVCNSRYGAFKLYVREVGRLVGIQVLMVCYVLAEGLVSIGEAAADASLLLGQTISGIETISPRAQST